MSFSNEGKINTFHVKKSQREFDASISALQ